MKSMFFFLILFFIQTLHCQWIIQNNLPNISNDDISFYNQKGWIAGAFAILVSDDFGETWAVNSFPNVYFYAVKPINENICFAVGGRFEDTSFVKRTTDGGSSWTDVYSSNNPELISICFPTEKTGYAAGGYASYSGYIIKTTDYGNSWDVIKSSNGKFSSIFFIDSTKGWATDQCPDISVSSRIWKTIDGGNHWTNHLFYPDRFYSIFFINENMGWAAGSSVFKTTDGGSNWIKKFTAPYGRTVLDIYFTDSLNGWVVGGSGDIFASTDGGENWVRQESGTYNFLIAIYMLNKDIGWIVAGNDSIILKTTNGGVTFIDEDIFLKEMADFNLLQNYPNPFNYATKIIYTIPKASFVSLKVYDSLGKEIAVLVNEEKYSGQYEVLLDTKELPSGIYFYKMQAGSYTATKKLILIK